jgi:hypothetical protein
MLSKAVKEKDMTKEQAVEEAKVMAKANEKPILVFYDKTEGIFAYAGANVIALIFPLFKPEDLVCIVGADGVVKN